MKKVSMKEADLEFALELLSVAGWSWGGGAASQP